MTHNIFDVFHIGPMSKEHVLGTLFIGDINLKEEKVNKSKIKYTSGKCLFEWQCLFVCMSTDLDSTKKKLKVYLI